MSDVTTNGPVTDKGTGLYPMTRPAEVTVDAPVGNVSTGVVPSSNEPVTVTVADPTTSSGAYPTPAPVTVHMWPSVPDGNTEASPPQDEDEDAAEPTPADAGKALTESDNKIVKPDTASTKSTTPARKAARARKGR